MLLSWLYEEPHVIVGSKNKVKGNIKFEGIIRIEGTVEGQLISHLKVSLINLF